jgi:predicted nucleic acid-binding protein
MLRQAVLDAGVVASALRSGDGASRRLLLLLGRADFEINVSVSLILEYEDAAGRTAGKAGLTQSGIDDIIDYLCRVANRHTVHFLWRPRLKGQKVDHVLELAVKAGCRFIVANNVGDFKDVEKFGIRAVTPKDFLRITGETR